MPKKEKQGMVVSSKMDKTVVVKVADYEPHPRYKKIIESNKHYKAHDAENVCNEGDIVRIVESKPVSKDKRWTVAEVVEKARKLFYDCLILNFFGNYEKKMQHYHRVMRGKSSRLILKGKKATLWDY